MMAFFLTGNESGVVSALTTAFGTIASDAMSAISSIVPVALPILGAVLVVMIGIKVFKGVAKK